MVAVPFAPVCDHPRGAWCSSPDSFSESGAGCDALDSDGQAQQSNMTEGAVPEAKGLQRGDDAAGLQQALYRREELSVIRSSHLTDPISNGNRSITSPLRQAAPATSSSLGGQCIRGSFSANDRPQSFEHEQQCQAFDGNGRVPHRAVSRWCAGFVTTHWMSVAMMRVSLKSMIPGHTAGTLATLAPVQGRGRCRVRSRLADLCW